MRRALLLLAVVVTGSPVQAELKLAKVFSDGMVLQQGETVRIWGTAVPDEDVELHVAGQSQVRRADGGLPRRLRHVCVEADALECR